jgi:hypothetical protein
MLQNENKVCERCGNSFECKAAAIAECRCSSINLSMEERVYIESKYKECLCILCLSDMKKEFGIFKEKFIFG